MKDIRRRKGNGDSGKAERKNVCVKRTIKRGQEGMESTGGKGASAGGE